MAFPPLETLNTKLQIVGRTIEHHFDVSQFGISYAAVPTEGPSVAFAPQHPSDLGFT